MIKKIVVSIMGIAMIGQLTIVDLGTECLKMNESEEEVVFNPAVVLYGAVNKACFEEEQDYQVFKEAKLKERHDNGDALAAWQEGIFSPEFSSEEEFLAMIVEERVRGNFSTEDLATPSAFNARIEQLTDNYNFSFIR